VQLEVLIGGEAALRRVYVEPEERETMEVNGLQVTVERDTLSSASIIRYMFTSPSDASLHVILTDALSGFPERVEGNEDISSLAQEIVRTLRFVQ
jgi:hypothetical protein